MAAEGSGHLGARNNAARRRDHALVRSVLCSSRARRKFFVLADIAGNVRKNKPAHDISPVALEAVKQIDAIFDIEINGLYADSRLAVRQARSRPLVEDNLIVSFKMNDIDPQAWIADVLARLPDIIVPRLPEFLPWNWKAQQEAVKAA